MKRNGRPAHANWLKKHGQDAHATGIVFMKGENIEERGFQPVDGLDSAISKRRGVCLPHWSRDGATYFVTWRLTDSVPRSVLNQYEEERVALDRLIDSGDEAARLRKSSLFTERVDAVLDKGHGDCVLVNAGAARIVADSITHFHGKRYTAYAYAVMPNHVHVLVQPWDGFELSNVVHSWKSFSSNRINALLGRNGALWQGEYFDHLVRDVENFERFGQYILNNPRNAGLENWEWVGSPD